MSVSLVALSIFLAFVSATAFAIVAVQGLLASRSLRRSAAATSPLVRRVVRLDSQVRTRGPVGRFDRWFLGLVRDSGLGWDPASTVLTFILCGIVAAGVLFLWREDPLPAALGLGVGLILPATYLAYRKRKRIRQLQEQLPTALDMLARSVRAGHSLDQALLLVGRQSAEPLAGEFRMCARQLEMGLSMSSVMRSLVDRVRLHDVRIFTTTLTVHRQTGGNIASVLERLARVVRDRLSYRRQLRVATGAGRASAMLVALVGPAVFLFFFFFRPEYINTMLHSPLGQTMLIAAAFLELVGLIWTARLLKPAY
jgi:tight adherence protein B